MPPPADSIEEYFTRTIVGDALRVEFGPAPTVRKVPTHRPWIEAIGEELNLHGVAAASLFQGERARSNARTPVSSARLHRLRRDLAAAAILLWSAALWLLFMLVYGQRWPWT
jgi:hypothetical protein